MYLLSEHAILVKVVLRESMLETAILQNSNDFIEIVCSDIELHCFKYGHMKMCHVTSYGKYGKKRLIC